MINLNELRDRAYKCACDHGFHDKEYSDEKEIWVDIPEYEESYQASNYGRIRSKDRIIKNKSKTYFRKGKIKGICNATGGYRIVGLCKNGKPKTWLVHILIAKCFIKNPFNKRTVNHIDCNKTNNNVTNLEWNTDSENIKYAFKNGKSPNKYWLGKTGYKSSRSSHILQLDKINLNVINEFGSAMDAGRKTGINDRDISSCIRGKLKSAGGFIWEKR
jgi:hypothetical protein